MRRLPAAVLSLACLATLGLVVLARPTQAASTSRVAHTCSATDRQFIQTTQLVMTDLGSWSQDMHEDTTTPQEIVRLARNESDRVSQTAPTDPSLNQTRQLIEAMLVEYAKALRAEAHQSPAAGVHMGRAWGLANSAHDTLSEAQSALMKKGCDIGPLM
jgi:hypothetical protein